MPIYFPSSWADETDGVVACVSSLRITLAGASCDFLAALITPNLEGPR
jgi:hypothetical protein